MDEFDLYRVKDEQIARELRCVAEKLGVNMAWIANTAVGVYFNSTI